jgi:hypothetical protein
VSVVVPVMVLSSTLVAVTVTLAGDEGAVNAPLELMVPALTVQATAEFKVPVPCTVALHCEVEPGATAAGVQEMETEETCEEVCWDGAEFEPPQALQTSIAEDATRSHTAERRGESILEDMR